MSDDNSTTNEPEKTDQEKARALAKELKEIRETGHPTRRRTEP